MEHIVDKLVCDGKNINVIHPDKTALCKHVYKNEFINNKCVETKFLKY